MVCKISVAFDSIFSKSQRLADLFLRLIYLFDALSFVASESFFAHFVDACVVNRQAPAIEAEHSCIAFDFEAHSNLARQLISAIVLKTRPFVFETSLFNIFFIYGEYTEQHDTKG